MMMVPQNSSLTMEELTAMGLGFNLSRPDQPRGHYGGDVEIVDMKVEHFCPQFSAISLVVTVPLLIVIASVACGDFLVIFNLCRNQHPNSKPVHLPTVCFGSCSLLNVLVLLYLQFYFIISKDYYCEIVNITHQFQVVVLAFVCTHSLVSIVRFFLLICRPSLELSEHVSSPQVRTTLVVIWFQAVCHCASVLVVLFLIQLVPPRFNLIILCLILAVPVVTMALFFISQAVRHCRRIRRYREFAGIDFPHPSIINRQCVIFKWVIMTACTVLLFWLPFWTKNVYDYLANPEARVEAFSFYIWIVVDVLLLSNSLILHLI